MFAAFHTFFFPSTSAWLFAILFFSSTTFSSPSYGTSLSLSLFILHPSFIFFCGCWLASTVFFSPTPDPVFVPYLWWGITNSIGKILNNGEICMHWRLMKIAKQWPMMIKSPSNSTQAARVVEEDVHRIEQQRETVLVRNSCRQQSKKLFFHLWSEMK